MGGWSTTSSNSPRSNNRWPRTAASSEVTASSDLSPRSPAKMMWTTCLAAKLFCGAIESTIATGPSTGTSSPSPISSSSSRFSASTRLSPELTPPPGSSQYSLPCFSCRQSRMRSCQRRIAETRMRGSTPTPLRTRRAEAPHAALGLGQLVALDQLDLGERQHHELRDSHSGLDDERRGRIGVQEDDLNLATVTRVDQPRCVHDRDPVARRKPRPRQHESAVSLRDRNRETRRHGRPLPWAELVPPAGCEVVAGVALVGPRWKLGVVVEAADRDRNHRVALLG